MPASWEINAEWEHLATGSPEERACFGALAIYANGHCLTEGQDALANRLRKAPYLSAYHLAEWLAWNWWRLRWEPRTQAIDWAMSHRMSSIGGGYIWPDITLSSDGERLAVVAHATSERPETLFRYINSVTAVLSASAFESGVDEFVTQVLERLNAEGLPHTNLADIWSEVLAEREDAEQTFQRKLEALMGHDPDEAPVAFMTQLQDDARAFGNTAAQELAASIGQSHGLKAPLSVTGIRDIARQMGHASSPQDRVCRTLVVPEGSRGQIPAWKLGVGAARLLRQQERLGVLPISNDCLAAMMGMSVQSLEKTSGKSDAFAFALNDSNLNNPVVLRARGGTGRRFELARLLGDCLMPGDRKQLYPATGTDTYQQQLQRAFAAELLCPFDTARDMLAGDYSDENQQDVADYFQVSDLTVRTQLVNNHLLERSELDHERFALAA